MIEAEIKKALKKLDEEFPINPNGVGALVTTIRRMKAEEEVGLPLIWRKGSAISVKTGKRANRMTEPEWNKFYSDLCENLKRDYSSLHDSLFPSNQ
ncbi:hypothetical protein [Winogradskyella arenosi]|uniref:Uncharacterized protein n=1 Tax=Winogradskyella arenosi TaxID=533325 RepID=A0A368ZI93_9FLAO|nr:hypothetical protein [Winogradskyella arenosi]RCW91998.1 hypothetical protein DFQ08_10217 [Winogradskyella arenosi]